MLTVVVELCEEVGRPLCPLRLHLHTIGRLGEDEKKRAPPDYENENGLADVQRDRSWRTDAAKVAAGSSTEAEPECPRIFWPGTTGTEGPIGRLPGPVAALGVFPTLTGPDIHSIASSSSGNGACGICRSRRIGSVWCRNRRLLRAVRRDQR